MKTVTIVKPFTFTSNDGKLHTFIPGDHDLDDDIASHFYVVAHSNNAPFVEPKAGTPEAAQLAAKRMQRRKILDAADEVRADDARRGTAL